METRKCEMHRAVEYKGCHKGLGGGGNGEIDVGQTIERSAVK